MLSLPRSSGPSPLMVSFTSVPSSFMSGLKPFIVGRLPVCSSMMSATMTGTTSWTESGSDLMASGNRTAAAPSAMLASSTACRRFTSAGPTASRAPPGAFCAASLAAARNFLRSGSTSSSSFETAEALWVWRGLRLVG